MFDLAFLTRSMDESIVVANLYIKNAIAKVAHLDIPAQLFIYHISYIISLTYKLAQHLFVLMLTK
jgi:hypothetical protein